MTRAEHLQWAKDRALEYIPRGDYQGAFTSFASDLGKHDELRDHVAIQLGLVLLIGGRLSTEREVRDFILGTG